MDRPTIFLSSTIYDFSDLRSALKDYLEDRGCRVLASEYTDFTRPLDAHSYEACLKTIEQADLFVLFIGRRVGGWLDKPNKISITRAEYRRAYQLAQEGRIRLLCFVRSEVLDHSQSIKELAKELSNDPALTDSQREKLINHPTRAMDDAEAIISFIDEISRNKETALAVAGHGEAPIANWLSSFSTFAEVRQALDPLVTHGLTRSQAAGRKALEVQLIEFIARLRPPRTKGKVFNPTQAVLNLRTKLNIKADQILSDITMTREVWQRLVTLHTFSAAAKTDHYFLSATLNSDLLLQYDPKAGAYIETQEYEQLSRLVEQSRSFAPSDALGISELYEHGKKVVRDGQGQVPAIQIIPVIGRLLRWVELIGVAKSLASSMGERSLKEFPSLPRTPIVDQEAQLEDEELTLDQVRQFIADHD
jgi:hypothetical protein